MTFCRYTADPKRQKTPLFKRIKKPKETQSFMATAGGANGQVEPGVRECQVRVRRLSDTYIKGCYTPCPLKGLAQQFRYLSNGQLYYDEKVISFHL